MTWPGLVVLVDGAENVPKHPCLGGYSEHCSGLKTAYELPKYSFGVLHMPM